jgi:hypothetical protein
LNFILPLFFFNSITARLGSIIFLAVYHIDVFPHC